ncbi:MAG: restriction endonuclease subunit S [Herbaspirillum sp.]
MEGTSGRQRVPSSAVEKYPIALPPLEEQRAIAHILGTLDDKIELNRRTNATLEAMARALFKSWFVDFDGVPPQNMQESELGLIPKGWRVGTLVDLCELRYGKALKATERRESEVPVYGSGGITGYHDEALVTKPTIIVRRKGTVGALYWQSAPCFPIDTVFYVEPRVSLHFCYYAMTQMGLHNLNTDAAVPGLNRDNAYRQNVVIPSANLMAKWDVIASSLHARMDSTDEQTATLAILRDALLPKLLSGELRVKDAERIAEAMA